MKKTLVLTALCMLLFGMGAIAQKVNTDSLSLVSKISANQLKLGKMQNEVDQKTKNKQDASEQAQKSATENAAAANKLSDNPDNRKLARQANSKAGDAKSDARSSRKETRRLDVLNKNIVNIKLKIAEDQARLNTYIPKDSTQIKAPQ